MAKKDTRKPSAKEKIDDIMAQTKFADSPMIQKAKELAEKIRARAEKELASIQNRKVPKTRKVLSADELEAKKIIESAKAEAKAIRESKKALISEAELEILSSEGYKHVLEANRIKRPVNAGTPTEIIWRKFFNNAHCLTAERTKQLASELKIDQKYSAHWACQMRKLSKLQDLGLLDKNGNATAKLIQESKDWKSKLNAAIVANIATK